MAYETNRIMCHTARVSLTFVYALVKSEMDTYFEDKCQEIVEMRKELSMVVPPFLERCRTCWPCQHCFRLVTQHYTTSRQLNICLPVVVHIQRRWVRHAALWRLWPWLYGSPSWTMPDGDGCCKECLEGEGGLSLPLQKIRKQAMKLLGRKRSFDK